MRKDSYNLGFKGKLVASSITTVLLTFIVVGIWRYHDISSSVLGISLGIFSTIAIYTVCSFLYFDALKSKKE